MNEEEKKAIERLEEQLNFWKKQNIKNSDCEIILNLMTKLQKENEEKDKQIDYIIDFIRERSIYAVDTHEKLKQYFEIKAKQEQ